jgi:hypothetical protein
MTIVSDATSWTVTLELSITLLESSTVLLEYIIEQASRMMIITCL